MNYRKDNRLHTDEFRRRMTACQRQIGVDMLPAMRRLGEAFQAAAKAMAAVPPMPDVEHRSWLRRLWDWIRPWA